MSKRYLKLFIEKIVIRLPKVDIVGKSEVVLAVLKNKKAVRTDGVLTALRSWLPGTDFLRFAQDKLTCGFTETEEPELKWGRKGPNLILAPRDGLEPPTKWLTATRSTN